MVPLKIPWRSQETCGGKADGPTAGRWPRRDVWAVGSSPSWLFLSHQIRSVCCTTSGLPVGGLRCAWRPLEVSRVMPGRVWGRNVEAEVKLHTAWALAVCKGESGEDRRERKVGGAPHSLDPGGWTQTCLELARVSLMSPPRKWTLMCAQMPRFPFRTEALIPQLPGMLAYIAGPRLSPSPRNYPWRQEAALPKVKRLLGGSPYPTAGHWRALTPGLGPNILGGPSQPKVPCKIFLQPLVQAHLRSPPPSGPHNPGLTPFMPPPAELRVLEQNLAHPPPALTRTTVFSPSLNLCKRITPHLRVLFLPSLSRQHSLQTGFVVSWIL